MFSYELIIGAIQVKHAVIILNMILLIMNLKTCMYPNPPKAQYHALQPLFETLTQHRSGFPSAADLEHLGLVRFLEQGALGVLVLKFPRAFTTRKIS